MGAVYTAAYIKEGDDYDRDDSVMYNIEILTIVFYNLVLAVAFTIIGILRMGRLYYSTEKQKKEMIIVSTQQVIIHSHSNTTADGYS